MRSCRIDDEKFETFPSSGTLLTIASRTVANLACGTTIFFENMSEAEKERLSDLAKYGIKCTKENPTDDGSPLCRTQLQRIWTLINALELNEGNLAVANKIRAWSWQGILGDLQDLEEITKTTKEGYRSGNPALLHPYARPMSHLLNYRTEIADIGTNLQVPFHPEWIVRNGQAIKLYNAHCTEDLLGQLESWMLKTRSPGEVEANATRDEYFASYLENILRLKTSIESLYGTLFQDEITQETITQVIGLYRIHHKCVYDLVEGLYELCEQLPPFSPPEIGLKSSYMTSPFIPPASTHCDYEIATYGGRHWTLRILDDQTKDVIA